MVTAKTAPPMLAEASLPVKKHRPRMAAAKTAPPMLAEARIREQKKQGGNDCGQKNAAPSAQRFFIIAFWGSLLFFIF